MYQDYKEWKKINNDALIELYNKYINDNFKISYEKFCLFCFNN